MKTHRHIHVLKSWDQMGHVQSDEPGPTTQNLSVFIMYSTGRGISWPGRKSLCGAQPEAAVIGRRKLLFYFSHTGHWVVCTHTWTEEDSPGLMHLRQSVLGMAAPMFMIHIYLGHPWLPTVIDQN